MHSILQALQAVHMQQQQAQQQQQPASQPPPQQQPQGCLPAEPRVRVPEAGTGGGAIARMEGPSAADASAHAALAAALRQLSGLRRQQPQPGSAFRRGGSSRPADRSSRPPETPFATPCPQRAPALERRSCPPALASAAALAAAPPPPPPQGPQQAPAPEAAEAGWRPQLDLALLLRKLGKVQAARGDGSESPRSQAQAVQLAGSSAPTSQGTSARSSLDGERRRGGEGWVL